MNTVTVDFSAEETFQKIAEFYVAALDDGIREALSDGRSVYWLSMVEATESLVRIIFDGQMKQDLIQTVRNHAISTLPSTYFHCVAYATSWVSQEDFAREDDF